MNSKKIAIIASVAAASLAVTVLAAFLPSKIAPLAVAALCYLLAFSLAGWSGGVLCGGVVLGLTFVLTGMSVPFVLTAVLVFPYSILAYAIKGLGYTKKTAVFRVLIVYAFFFSAVLLALWAGAGLSGSSLGVLQSQWGIWIACAVFAAIALPADILIVTVCKAIVNRIGKKELAKKEDGKRSGKPNEDEDIYKD